MPHEEPSPAPDHAKTDWEWRQDEFTTRGVSVGEAGIVYWEQGPHGQGGAQEQSVLDLLAFGPPEQLPGNVLAGMILKIRAPVWCDAWSVSFAAILAAIGGIAAALSLDRARELGAGEIVRGISVAAAPQHPEATGFVFRDAHVLAGQSGTYRHVSLAADQAPVCRRVSAK